MTSTKTGPVLVLGGARSGKSTFAEKLVTTSGLGMHYVATGRAWDGEMQARIDEHRDRRGPDWQTHEEPLEVAACLKAIDAPDRVVLIDCLTLWITNLMMADRDMAAEFQNLAEWLPQARARLVFVSNEVGLGIVPENRMARDFRDHAGRLHQLIAEKSAEVYFIAAGLPLKMKG